MVLGFYIGFLFSYFVVVGGDAWQEERSKLTKEEACIILHLVDYSKERLDEIERDMWELVNGDKNDQD